jgi:hypothetical protein
MTVIIVKTRNAKKRPEKTLLDAKDLVVTSSKLGRRPTASSPKAEFRVITVSIGS